MPPIPRGHAASDTQKTESEYTIRLLIADDHSIFRQGLRLACQAEAGFEVVGEAENGQEAVELARRLQPDVILMDTEMPLLDGVQATRFIAAENPEMRVIMLAIYRQDERLFDALKAGAWGYLLKDADEETLIEVVQAAHRGEALLDPSLAARLLKEVHRLARKVVL